MAADGARVGSIPAEWDVKSPAGGDAGQTGESDRLGECQGGGPIPAPGFTHVRSGTGVCRAAQAHKPHWAALRAP